MRQTKLRPSPDGYYRRNLGYVRTKTGKRSPHKVNLGRNFRSAEARLKLVSAIWSRLEAEARRVGEEPIWDKLSLKIIKAIGEGEASYKVERLFAETDERYCQLVDAVASSYSEIAILPADEEAYRRGKQSEQELSAKIELLEKEALADAAQIKRLVLEIPGNDTKYVDLLGDQTLHQALDEYSKYIADEKFDQSESAVNDTGLTQQSMVKQIKTYLVPDRPLASLHDLTTVDQLFGVFRKRPTTFRYKKPMARKTASNLIGELGRFFDWLHRSTEWEWRKPEDFSDIKRSPGEMESDIRAEAEDIPVYTVQQLSILYTYATPLERLLLALALNCAFGADQIGRLRIREIETRDGVFYVNRIRRKQKVRGIHRLFPTTVEGIQWATAGRADQEDAHVLVNGKGKPLWRKTKTGKRSKDIPNAWYRLLDRVCADDPTFPRHGFNTLRDTSTDLVRSFAGEELASLHCTHKHQSADINLNRYSNPRRKQLFKAHQVLEKRLADVFAVEDAWKERVHQYISTAKVLRMKELRRQGMPAREIAKEVGVSIPTVYRHTN